MRINGESGFVVRDGEGGIMLILVGADAVEAASWYAEDGFEVDEVDLAPALVAA